MKANIKRALLWAVCLALLIGGIAAAEPERCVIVNAAADPETVENEVTAAVFAALERHLLAQPQGSAPT